MKPIGPQVPHRFDDGGGVTPDGATVIVADGQDRLVVPDDFDLLHGDFSRDGSDLVVVAPDGARLTVADYFDSESPPDLVTANGATLSADLVTRLAGPMAPGMSEIPPGGFGSRPVKPIRRATSRSDSSRVLPSLSIGTMLAVRAPSIIAIGSPNKAAKSFPGPAARNN